MREWPTEFNPPSPLPSSSCSTKGNGEVVCGRLGLGGQFHLVGSSAAMPYLSAAQEVSFVPEWPRLQEKKAACSRWALGRREGGWGGGGWETHDGEELYQVARHYTPCSCRCCAASSLHSRFMLQLARCLIHHR